MFYLYSNTIIFVIHLEEVVLSSDLRCYSLSECKSAGTGCKDSPSSDHESCGICCTEDYCNKPEFAKFTSELEGD